MKDPADAIFCSPIDESGWTGLLRPGLALAESGQIDWAIRAFNVALEQNPNNSFPHRCLAQERVARKVSLAPV